MTALDTQALADQLLEVVRALRRLTHPVRRGEITLEQYLLLRRLSQEDALSVGEIAAALGIGQSAATMACQRLERQGLVTRQRDLPDERVVRVALTSAGRARISAWAARGRDAVARVLGCLGPDDLAALQQLLPQVLARAEELLQADPRGD